MKQLSALALLAATFLGTITSASAQSTVARDGNFYEEVNSVFCNGGNSCALQFSATPQLILFSKINCLVQISPQGAIFGNVAFEIRDVSGGPSRRREFLPIPSPITAAPTNNYNFMSATDFMMSASKFPVIEIFYIGANGAFVECKITGRLQ